MNWDELRPLLVSTLKAQGLTEYKGSELSFDKPGNATFGKPKDFIIRVEALDEKSITWGGSIGTYKAVIEILYTFTDLTQYNKNIQLFSSHVSALYDDKKFLGTNGDPAIKQIDSHRFTGIIKLFYGLRGS